MLRSLIDRMKKAIKNFFETPQEKINQGVQELNELFRAAETGDLKTLEQHFRESPGPFGQWDIAENGMLLAAVRNGHEKAVRLMLDNGVPAETRALGYDTYIVDEARAKGHHAIAQMLEEAIKKKWAIKPGEEDDEVDSLTKMSAAVNADFKYILFRRFGKAGKEKEFKAAVEIEEQNAPTLDGPLHRLEVKRLFLEVRLAEVFARAARRIEDDKTLAALLPPLPYDELDAEILERKNLPALSALVSARIKQEPKP